jgi:hypothetical protein
LGKYLNRQQTHSERHLRMGVKNYRQTRLEGNEATRLPERAHGRKQTPGAVTWNKLSGQARSVMRPRSSHSRVSVPGNEDGMMMKTAETLQAKV